MYVCTYICTIVRASLSAIIRMYVNFPSSEPIDVIQEKTMEAKRMVGIWKQAYLDVRAKIEASERDARWEFDRRKLFDRTDYSGSICQDIHDVVQVCTYIQPVHVLCIGCNSPFRVA